MLCLSIQALRSSVCNRLIWQACFVRPMWFDTMSLGLVRFSGNDRLVLRNCLSIDCRHNSACLFSTEAQLPLEGTMNTLSVYSSKLTVQVFLLALLSCHWQNDSCPICNLFLIPMYIDTIALLTLVFRRQIFVFILQAENTMRDFLFCSTGVYVTFSPCLMLVITCCGKRSHQLNGISYKALANTHLQQLAYDKSSFSSDLHSGWSSVWIHSEVVKERTFENASVASFYYVYLKTTDTKYNNHNFLK